MNRARWMLTAILPGVIACAGSDWLPPLVPPEAFEVQIKENPELRRFDIRLVSRVRYSICITQDQWSNGLGQLESSARLTKLRSGDIVLTAKESNFGFCTGPQCRLRIPPGESLEGFIGFDQFGDPVRIAALPNKRLEFGADPVRCEPGIG